ncbi:unnamed protein product, partial [marine sediment metagenome]
CCTVACKNKMRWYADWIRDQVKKLGVEVKYNTEAKAAELKKYDVVILATGGTITRPDIPGIELPLVVSFEDVLRCENKNCRFYPKAKPKPVKCGNTVLIWGDHFGAADTAEKLGVDGKKVYIVTENAQFASWMEPCHYDVMLKRFAGSNGEGLKGKKFKHTVTIITNSTVVEIKKNGQVTLMDSEFNKSELEVNNVVLGKVEPDNTFYEKLLAAGLTVEKIGDLKQVRNLRGAVTDGANISLELDAKPMLNANNAVICNLPTGVDI